MYGFERFADIYFFWLDLMIVKNSSKSVVKEAVVASFRYIYNPEIHLEVNRKATKTPVKLVTAEILNRHLPNTRQKCYCSKTYWIYLVNKQWNFGFQQRVEISCPFNNYRLLKKSTLLHEKSRLSYVGQKIESNFGTAHESQVNIMEERTK
jgi:hypothetical protein